MHVWRESLFVGPARHARHGAGAELLPERGLALGSAVDQYGLRAVHL